MIDPLWETGEYETWLETRRTKPTVGVHRALIRWTDGVVRDSHLKIVFDDGSKPHRHLEHEMIGWLLGKTLGLPVPVFAGFMVLSPEQVERAHSGRPSGEALAWVTSTEPERTLQIEASMEAEEHLTRELQKWKRVCDACTFDEWLGNTDRYPRNLLRRGEADFVLIDHDFIAGGPHWLADLLIATTGDHFTNVLRDRCSPLGLGDPGPERAFSNAMVARSETFPDAMAQAGFQIRDWMERLMESEEDREAIALFLLDRANTLHSMIRRRYKLLV